MVRNFHAAVCGTLGNAAGGFVKTRVISLLGGQELPMRRRVFYKVHGAGCNFNCTAVMLSVKSATDQEGRDDRSVDK